MHLSSVELLILEHLYDRFFRSYVFVHAELEGVISLKFRCSYGPATPQGFLGICDLPKWNGDGLIMLLMFLSCFMYVLFFYVLYFCFT